MATAGPQHRFASIGRRVFSYVAEVFLLFTGLLALQGMLFALRLNPLAQGVLSGAGFSRGEYHLWLLGTVDLPLILYYTGTLGSPARATIVMRWLGLRLEAASGGSLGYARALLRTVVMLIPFEVNHFFVVWANSPEGIPDRLALQYALVGALILAYVGTAALSPRRQSIHDRVAGTVVVRTAVVSGEWSVVSGWRGGDAP